LIAASKHHRFCNYQAN